MIAAAVLIVTGVILTAAFVGLVASDPEGMALVFFISLVLGGFAWSLMEVFAL